MFQLVARIVFLKLTHFVDHQSLGLSDGGTKMQRLLLAVFLAAGLGNSAAAQEKPRPLPADVVAIWKKAGAEVGWMGENRFGISLYQTEPNELTGIVPAFVTSWPADVAKLPDPAQPFGLNLIGAPVTDERLKELAGFKSLQALYLASTPVTDAGLKELAGLESLQTLNLGSTKVTDAGLKELAALKNLQTLNLSITKVTGAGLKGLAGIKKLRTLILMITPVTDAGVKELAGLKSLQTLNLLSTKVTDAALKEIAGLKSCKYSTFGTPR